MDEKCSRKARISNGKSRSGCRRCKIRRVKCDESKPSCSRCLKSGWSCDGYGILLKASPGKTQEASLSNLDVHIYRSERENRGFDYFRHKALTELIGFDTKSDFWSHVVLQSSEASPAVFRAVLGLSSLHEATYSHQVMKIDPDNKVAFLRQYNKAIRQLCSRQTEQPIQFTLTCCILFICLENLRGDYDTAMMHLEKGLEILKAWYLQTAASSNNEAREIITRVFQRLDMQATTFRDSRQPQFNMSSLGEASIDSANKSTSFKNLQEARTNLESLASKLFYIITSKSDSQHPSWSAHNQYLPARKSLLQGITSDFVKWKLSFDTLSLQEKQYWREDDLRLSILLALHYQTSTLMLDIRLHTNTEGQYFGVSKDAQWASITDICQSMITSLASSRPSFSADLGLIAPLYFTAMQAGNPYICQRAIDLLYQIKWKEGFWDAATAAKVAEKILHNHITGPTGIDSTDGIGELAKVHHVTCSE